MSQARAVETTISRVFWSCVATRSCRDVTKLQGCVAAFSSTDLMEAMQPRGVVLVEGTSDQPRRRDARASPWPRPRGRGRRRRARWAGTGTSHASSSSTATSDSRDSTTSARSGTSCARSGATDRGELERAGFYACTRDLEDELTRAVGPEGMERVLAEQGELRAFRTYQKQPAHRDRPLEEQLHGFMWNRKQRYAVLLVEALDLDCVPRPLGRVLEQFDLEA